MEEGIGTEHKKDNSQLGGAQQWNTEFLWHWAKKKPIWF